MRNFPAFLSVLCLLFIGGPQAFGKEALDIQLNVNEGELLRLNDPVLDIFITNPDIADIQLTQGNGVFVYGRLPGRTHVMILTDGDKVIFDRYVQVSRDLGRLETLIHRQFPKQDIQLEQSVGRLIVSGDVHSAAAMENILSLVRGYLQDKDEVVNQLVLQSPLQVNLKVQIMEVNREETEELGINWNALLDPGSLAIGLVTGRSPSRIGDVVIPKTGLNGSANSVSALYRGSNGSVSAVIDALAEENLVTVLAEPNLTSRSGETASFFAGGEFPIPVAASDEKITVEFKKFGVILDMTPTVLSPDRINLHIRSEVSELSGAGAVIIEQISIPGISIRRAEAKIDLASGQSFSVAGLMRNQNRTLIQDVPWLSDLDVLGPLFRSNEYQKSESELVIIATANIVKPVHPGRYRTPVSVVTVEDDLFIRQHGKMLKEIPKAEKEPLEGGGGLQLLGPRGYIY